MGKNQESPTVIESLAIVTDAIQTLFPEGKIICVYELNETDFKKVQSGFRKIDQQYIRFSINISDLEHVFIMKNSLIELKPKQIPKKKFIQKLLSFFKSSGSPI